MKKNVFKEKKFKDMEKIIILSKNYNKSKITFINEQNTSVF